ncbi:MAG: hypothetical protein HY279_09015 [Nitrospinae bacterium]|nr:hypothetical protein [Nitrospinota bacterium]
MRKKERKIIDSISEIPKFKSEDEERAWWADHDFSEKFYNELEDTTNQLDKILPLPKRRASKKVAYG